MSAERKVVPRAMALVTALFFGVFGLAKARTPLSSAPSAGRSGMSRSRLAIQLPRLVDIDRAAQAVQLDDDGQTDGGFTGRHSDDEDREDLPFQVREALGEGNQVDVD